MPEYPTDATAFAMLANVERHELVIKLPQNKRVTIETGEIGRLAGGAVMVTSGDTMVYATACAAPKPMDQADFLPLGVHYGERMSAAGRTLCALAPAARCGAERVLDVFRADSFVCRKVCARHCVRALSYLSNPSPIACKNASNCTCAER